jgi:hypothetical protein
LGIFFLNGLALASWVVRIPAVQEKLTLSEGLLGLALLGVAVGALAASYSERGSMQRQKANGSSSLLRTAARCSRPLQP